MPRPPRTPPPAAPAALCEEHYADALRELTDELREPPELVLSDAERRTFGFDRRRPVRDGAGDWFE